MANFPISPARLSEIANKACEEALGGATEYTHGEAKNWNQTIINKMIESLVAETTTDASASPPYKFAVNSTVIQNSVGGGSVAKRGMFSSVGAFWNSEKDGMWSFKHDLSEKFGLDIVLSVIWISL